MPSVSDSLPVIHPAQHSADSQKTVEKELGTSISQPDSYASFELAWEDVSGICIALLFLLTLEGADRDRI